MSDEIDRSPITGTSVEFQEKLFALALEGNGDPGSTDPEEIGAALFSLLVVTIREYAAWMKEQAPGINGYNWRSLSNDIAEQFQYGWINPDAEQEAYLNAESVVRMFERVHGKPSR